MCSDANPPSKAVNDLFVASDFKNVRPLSFLATEELPTTRFPLDKRSMLDIIPNFITMARDLAKTCRLTAKLALGIDNL